MIPKKVLQEINDQIKYEFYSHYYYLAMASWCELENLTGSSHFFRLQAEEERKHAMKFYNYVLERTAQVRLDALDAPRSKFDSLADVFAHALEHEKFVTKLIYKLMDTAQKENDHPTVNLLRWFVDEQVEEESSMERILERLKLAGTSGAGILIMDAELGRRAAAG